LADDTLVIYLSDHGGPTRELTSSNAPFRGGKGELYEGGIRVPLVMRWPGQGAAGRTIDTPISALDLRPTILAATGAKASHDAPLDGYDLAPLWSDPPRQPPAQLTERVFYWRLGPHTALRDGRWKIVKQGTFRQPAESFALFDLADDPTESRDLAASQPDVLKRLVARHARLDAQMVAPLWPPAP
jgi:arylsulfatase A-like enzyme